MIDCIIGREMNTSHGSIHPVDEAPTTDVGDVAPIVRMKDIEGMPGTRGGLALRCIQLGFAVAAFAVMAASRDFPSVSAFRCFFIVSINFFVSFNSVEFLF